MDIRLFQYDELPSLLQLYKHLHDLDDPLPEEAIVQSVWRELNESARCRYFGGWLDEMLISSCTITIIPNLTRGCRPYGVIENVVTDANFRGKGHGKAMLAHALAYAWSVSCYKVMLLTGRKDEATLGFYESAGFDRNGKQAFIAKPPSGSS